MKRHQQIGMNLISPRLRQGFTLVELLVSVAIIAVLISVLIPSLYAARNLAKRTQCTANLRSISQMTNNYTIEFGVYPPAFVFGCPQGALGIGLQHWSDLLANRCPNPYFSFTPKLSQAQPVSKVFLCAAFDRGGLPPANTPSSGKYKNTESGQSTLSGDYDRQAYRLAYVANDAIITRPFMQGISCDKWQGIPPFPVPEPPQAYRFVKPTEINAVASTVLYSEWHTDWRMVRGSQSTCMSFTTVHGFASTGAVGSPDWMLLGDVLDGTARDPYEVCYVPRGGAIRQVRTDEVLPEPPRPAANLSRLNLLGRNHGGKTNFAYVDGHVESKKIEDTVASFEWGERYFSLQHGIELLSQ